MKTLIKTYALALLLMVAFIPQATAQTRRSTNNKTTTVKRTTVNRVPSNRVVYRTPTRKVVSVRTVPNNRVLIRHNGQNYYYF